MKTKSNGPIRILSVAFAITLLAAYVVYSQLEHNRALAPSSKSLVLGSIERTNLFAANPGSNSSLVATQLVGVPPSNALAAVFAAQRIQLQQSNKAPVDLRNSMVLSSSKSGAVFDPVLVKAAWTNLDWVSPARVAQTNGGTMILHEDWLDCGGGSLRRH